MIALRITPNTHSHPHKERNRRRQLLPQHCFQRLVVPHRANHQLRPVPLPFLKRRTHFEKCIDQSHSPLRLFICVQLQIHRSVLDSDLRLAVALTKLADDSSATHELGQSRLRQEFQLSMALLG